ncbi:site-specific recombinase, phage integrase family protein [Pseudogulbenkiania sp. NH8B]|nr:site-specific recombinase, phage integrase family protein [Pseudogulbenkiania sp. NH8B]
MATITKYRKRNGELSYSAQVRVKQDGKVVFSKSRSFPTRDAAESWAKRIEVQSAEPGFIERHKLGKVTIGELLERYRDELTEAGRLGRSKGYVLDLLLRSSISEIAAINLTSADVVEHCKVRAAAGAGPATVQQDVIYLRTMLDHAARAWHLPVSVAPVDAASAPVRKLGLTGKSRSRSRRPTEEELELLLGWLASREAGHNASIPHRDIVRFAIASAMRLGEIGRIEWADLNEQRRTVMIRQRKSPSNKLTNDQEVPLLGEAWEIVARQPRTEARIFPYNMDSVSAAFERGCKAMGVIDLRFHDLRHEGASRLFEQGYSIQEVALVTGHQSWNNLKRYTQLKPESLHDKQPPRPAPPVALPEIPVSGAGVFVGRWHCEADVLADYGLDAEDLDGGRVLFAASHDGHGAFVLFEEAGTLYQVVSDGAVRDWLPEPTTVNKVRHRAKTGKLGMVNGRNEYGNALINVLAGVGS